MAQTGRNEPCPCGSGKKFKKCCGSIQSDAEIHRTIKMRGLRVSQDYKNRAQLRRVGPVIKGEWHLDPETRNQLASKGEHPPEPVAGYILIDTGAAETAIDEDVARELNLTPIARIEAHGVGGTDSFVKVNAQIILQVGDVNGVPLKLGLYRDVLCAPKLRRNHDTYGLIAPDGSPMRIIGLLGRDFLQFAKLTYNGLQGSWDMEIDESVMRPQQGV
ncbi:MAG TPA: SEC-C metal-binding domain-containing protein [Pyrinomonadaceae bacterium]|jgi:hypothetical protein|nr:SEC-C metal-binding domain-containing protein [Pyrinomonadaceae bacterium]